MRARTVSTGLAGMGILVFLGACVSIDESQPDAESSSIQPEALLDSTTESLADRGFVQHAGAAGEDVPGSLGTQLRPDRGDIAIFAACTGTDGDQGTVSVNEEELTVTCTPEAELETLTEALSITGVDVMAVIEDLPEESVWTLHVAEVDDAETQ